jgi:hypothetical protein
MLFVRDCEPLFDATGRLSDAPTRERLAALLVAFIAWIKQLRGQSSPAGAAQYGSLHEL